MKIVVFKMKRLLVLFLSLFATPGDGTLVTTSNGQIQGRLIKINSGRKIRAFFGVRYAQPPIGELRFMPPQPLEKWDGIQEATEMNHAICAQRNILIPNSEMEGEEDCLFLNVYTPKNVSKNKLLPVIMYVHGGAFLFGTGNYQAFRPDNFLKHDVVFVVINYRLGPMGFLSTADDVVPGNNGLKDQTMALKWIQENIENFGGDSSKVTIIGQSAGAVCTHLHVISPRSKGLFRASISESGTALGSWSVAPPKYAYDVGRKLARILNCPSESSSEMIDCMRKIDAKRFYDVLHEFQFWDIDPLSTFIPVIEIDHEGAFISEHPEETIKSGKVNPVTWLTGVNTEDGCVRSSVIIENGLLEEFKENFDAIVPVSTYYHGNHTLSNDYTNAIRDYYFAKGFSTEQLTNLYTDNFFFVGAENSLKLHREYNNITLYYYLFGYRGSKSWSETLAGVCHSDQLFYFFPIENGSKPTKQDMLMTERFTNLWMNFIYTKQPTPINSKWPYTKWEPVQTDNNEFFFIGGPDKFEMGERLFADRLEFWDSLKPLLRSN
ncbi:PREDICTED: venom carboxylesterase-6-like [Nicrophorus vespilloides]|uniref:Carboxylic ester hydrolase n=1 Tax=Nicrophorus vespilloides TaxID=110193 RepID=A0ABM1NAN5_NICVS|nr:PREDICTED: venom carboxylesterase-6-like [Nicrophorus vespilloides]